MNYIDIILIVFTVVCVIIGAKKGLVLSLLSFVRILIATPLSYFVSNNYNQQIYDNYVKDNVIESVKNYLAEYANVDEGVASFKESLNSVPDFLISQVDLSLLDSFDNENIALYITDNIIEPIAITIIKILLFVLTFLIFCLITGVIIKIAKKSRKDKNKPLHKTNGVLGGAFGAAKALTVVFVLSTVAGFYCTLDAESEFSMQLQNSVVFDFINNINPLL